MMTMVLKEKNSNKGLAGGSHSIGLQVGNLVAGFLLAIMAAGPAVAGPTGGDVVGGNGSITQSDNLTLINQLTDRISINWDTFNVSAQETVQFVQPSSTSVALNTIFDQNPSQIFGTITANGRVLLINPNGMVFGATAQINVAGLIASSLSISTADFMAGNYSFEAMNGSDGLVLNQGTLEAAPGGFIALLGHAVANEGLIIADAGTIAMGSGSKVALDFDGTGLLYFEVESEVLNSALGVDDAVSNTGSLVADGGKVLLTAAAAQDVFTQAINNDGVIQARRIDNQGGVIRLSGGSGTTINTGVLDASGDAASDGGSIHVTGNYVGLGGNATLTADGGLNGGQVLVGGGYQGNDASVQNAERTFVGGDVSISADAGSDGNGGEVIVWGDDVTRFYGNISATGGAASGNGGFAEVSGLNTLGFFGNVDLSAANGAFGTLLLDPTTLEILGGNGGGVLALDASLPEIDFTEGAATDFVSAEAIEAQVADVVLRATDSIIVRDLNGNGGDGDITMANNVSITLETRNSTVDGDGAGTISFDDTTDSIVTQGTGSITITAGTVGTAGSSITNTGILTTAGGAVTLTAAGDITVTANINSNDGAVNITADDSVTITAGATIAAGAGNVGVRVDNADDSQDTLAVLGDITSTGTVTLAGSAINANDVLQGSDTGNTWVIDGADTGTLEGWDFNDFASLQGGAGADAFAVTGTGSLSGAIDGAGGANSLDVSAATGAVTVNLGDSSATPLNGGAAGGFSNIADFTGDNTSDTLIGPNGGATFTTSGTNDGTVAGVTYTDFVNITGGTGADTFNLNNDVTGTVDGGGGGDTINVNAALSGDVAGGAGNDIINLTANVAGTVDGGDDDDTINLTNGVSVGTLTGGAGGTDSDTLVLVDVGGNQTNDWVINAADAGTVEGQAFTEMENLTGNDEDDVFTFTAALTGTAFGGAEDDTFVMNGGSAGTIDGGTQATAAGDEVTYAGAGGPVLVSIDGFTNIETLTGSGNAGDTLQGTAGGDAFTVDGANSGTAGGINYFGFENLVGLGGNDTFTLAVGGSVTSIDGGTGSDTIIGNDGGNAFVINAANAGTANGVGFTGIENLTGGAAGDLFTFNVNNDGGLTTLDGLGGDDEVTYAGAAGPVTIAIDRFTNIETLTGSGNAGDTLQGTAGGDAFTVDGANSGTAGGIDYAGFENLDGLDGNDTFTVNTGGTVTSITGGFGSDTVIGDATDANAFVVNAANAGTVNGIGFTGIENLTGGAGSDVFTVAAGGSLAGTVSGQGGNDELDVAGAAAVTVNLGDGSATVLNGGAAGGFSSIESFTGNGTDDTLVATAGNDTFDTTGENDGTVAGITYTDFANIDGAAGDDTFNLQHNVGGDVDGGAGDDTYNLSAGVTIGGTMDGGSEDDELLIIGGAGPNNWVVNAADSGTLNGQAFANVENLTGNDNVDTFTFTAALSGTAAGAGGNDVFDVGDNGLAGQYDGGAGSDSLSFATRTTGAVLDMADASGIESFTGSNQADTFTLNGDQGNSITIDGGGGDDEFAVVSASVVSGDLTVSNVETTNIGADLTATTIGLSGGSIAQSAGIVTAGSITTASVGGQSLITATSSLTVSNSGGGAINLTNTGDLTVTSISQSGGGATSVDTSGSLALAGAATADGSIALTAGGSVDQSADITSSGGDITVASTGGSIVMDENVVTRSSGGDITYETTGVGADITLATLKTCDDCSLAGSTGDVVVRAEDGSIIGYEKPNPDDAHITAVSASLIAGFNIGSGAVPIKLRKMNASGNASNSGAPIFLEFSGTANVDSEFGIGVALSETANLGGLTLSTVLSQSQASADQAANQEDAEEVDWAAYSEDITLYEINNEGIKLPDQEEVDEFAKIEGDEAAVPIAQIR